MLVAGSRVGLLAGGFFLIVWGCKGDTEFHCNHFRIPSHWSSNFPCADCPADTSTSPMRWSNFKADAPWKVLGFAGNTERWLRHVAARGKNAHIIFKAVADGGPGLGTEHLFRDTLHICCLGILPHLLGNTLWELCFTTIISSVRTPAGRMNEVWERITDKYKQRQTGSQFNWIDLSTFADETRPNAEYPTLSGKGAEMRHLLPVLLTLAFRFYQFCYAKLKRKQNKTQATTITQPQPKPRQQNNKHENKLNARVACSKI